MSGTSQFQRPSFSRMRGPSAVTYYLALLLCLFLSTSVFAQTQNYQPYPEPSLNPNHLPHFRGLDVGDNIKVTLIPSQRQKIVVLNQDQARLYIAYEKGVLVLRDNEVDPSTTTINPRYSKPVPPPIYVKIWVGQLNYLRVAGYSHVDSHGVRFPAYSTLEVVDQGSLRLRGNDIHFNKLIYNSSHDLNIEWVNSHHLIFRGYGSGTVRMAGIVYTLDAKLYDASCLDAKYLRIKRAYVETQDSAIAMVTPIEFLNAFAMNYSNIYFYKTPLMLTRDTTQSGNVLQLAYHN